MEKCADFPIVNANLHIQTNHARLFDPCIVLERDGMKILFIGILTEAVLAQCKNDGIIGTFVSVEDAAEEIGRICNTYNATDIDFTVLLTHIGFEEDKKLAELLDPAWGVDVIIGVTLKELQKNHKDRVISTSCTQIIEESLLAGQHQNAGGEGRLILNLTK